MLHEQHPTHVWLRYDFLNINRIHGYFSDMVDVKKFAIYIDHVLNLKFNEKIWAFQFHFD